MVSSAPATMAIYCALKRQTQPLFVVSDKNYFCINREEGIHQPQRREFISRRGLLLLEQMYRTDLTAKIVIPELLFESF